MCLEFEKYQELCQEVLVESAAVCQNLMNNHGVQRDGLDEVAGRLLEESIMVYLRTMKDATKDKDKKATLRSLVELCKHILAECCDTARAHYFLAVGLKNDIQHLTNILDPGACDVKALQDTLKKVAATKDLENGSMIMQNLATHVACAGLLKSAKDCAEQREDEAFYSTEFDAVEKAIGETPTDVDDIVAIGKQLAPFVQCNCSLCAVADQVKQRKAPWLVERATKLIQALGERVTQYLQAVLHEVVTQIYQRNPVDVVGMNASLVTALQLTCDLDEKRLKEQWNLVKLMSEMFCFTDKVSLKMDMPYIVDAFSQQNNARLRVVLACARDMVDMLNALGMSAAVKRAVRDELDTMDALFGQVVVHSKGEINNSFKSLVSGNQRMAPLVQQSDKAIEIAAFCQDDVAPFIALRGMAALYWDTLFLPYSIVTIVYLSFETYHLSVQPCAFGFLCPTCFSMCNRLIEVPFSDHVATQVVLKSTEADLIYPTTQGCTICRFARMFCLQELQAETEGKIKGSKGQAKENKVNLLRTRLCNSVAGSSRMRGCTPLESASRTWLRRCGWPRPQCNSSTRRMW
jgi:hypothetical protein